jgi:hypothetical protein
VVLTAELGEDLSVTRARFQAALDSLVAKLEQDRYVIAAILFGSLSHDTVWRKSDIDLVLIGREERSLKFASLVEDGVNIHALMYPRSQFKQAIERSFHGAFGHSAFSLSTLLFTTDEAIRTHFEAVKHLGAHDRQMRLLDSAGGALRLLAKAEKWLYVRGDHTYSALWILLAAQELATIEVLLQGQLTTREVIPQALALNPAFFGPIYRDLIDRPNDHDSVHRALTLIDGYLRDKVQLLFGPIFRYLAGEGAARTTTELSAYLEKISRADSLSSSLEWLADEGYIQRVTAPLYLHPKSRVALDEPAYYYDGVDA